MVSTIHISIQLRDRADCQHPPEDSQPPLTQIPPIWRPLLAFVGTKQSGTKTYRQAKHSHAQKIKMNQTKNLKEESTWIFQDSYVFWWTLTVKNRINIKLSRDTDFGSIPEVIKTGKQQAWQRGGNGSALRVKESRFSGVGQSAGLGKNNPKYKHLYNGNVQWQNT